MSPRAVLVAVLGLLLVTELALSPFYPQVLDRLYGAGDPATVGALLWACRLAALLALPALGLLARRAGLVRTVAWGLGACVLADGALVLAPSAAAFVAISAVAAGAGASLLLAYPALVALDGDGDLGVVAFVALLHGATVVATGVGAAITGLPDPRVGLLAFVAVDLLLLALVLPVMGRFAAAPSPARASWRELRGPLLAVAAVAIAFDLAANVVRPFFTSHAQALGASLDEAALLYALPSVAALAVLPLRHAARRAAGGALLAGALLACALGLVLQAGAGDVVGLVIGRVLLGAGLGLAHVELDRVVFGIVGADGLHYAAVESLRGVALLVAGPLAAAGAAAGLAVPLATGAAIFALAAAVVPVLSLRPRLQEPARAASR